MNTFSQHRFFWICLFFSVAVILSSWGVKVFYPAQTISVSQKATQPPVSPAQQNEQRAFSSSVPAITPSPENFPPLQLEDLWKSDHSRANTLSPDKKVSVVVTGDVLLARTVNNRVTTTKDYRWPFAKTAEVLRAADVTFINLETPLTPDCLPKTTGMVFCGHTRNIESLQFAGVDVVNFANNHAANQGLQGVESTVQTLQGANMLVAGVSGPVYTTVGSTKIAFLGYNEVNHQAGVTTAEQEVIKRQVRDARLNADVVIVAFHWGNEYTYQPTQHQRMLGALALDEGADIIVGHHPHWVQAIEFYKNKPIFYSHGNFVFDQMWSQETREGLVTRLTFYDKKLVDIELLPVLIEDYGQPYFVEGAAKKRILDILYRESQKLLAQ